jgi:RNA polymerase sigma factor (TIGR02999 family)
MPGIAMEQEDATILMNAAAAGDRAATDRLLPLVYDQLRKAAQADLAGERAAHTLSATALVHEAYLKLVGPREVPWAGRGHFYAAAAEAMRRILIDRARQKRSLRRGGDHQRIDLDKVDPAAASSEDDRLLALDEALARLAQVHPDKAELVKLRHFAGLSLEEAASALGLSRAAAYRHWEYSRAWLLRELEGPGRH